ncbi:MAG: PAS domain S-box protein, partial [Kiritimatiellia bacterium]|nr:PAS domain S-box protein [Kiritimatiellia bacterium]
CDAMLIADMKGAVVDTNPRAEELMALPREEILGKPVRNILTGFDDSMLASILPNLRRRRFALVQAWCSRKNEAPFAAEIAVSLLQSVPEQLCLFIRDVTRRKQSETLLQTGYNAMQNAASGISIVDMHGRIEYANPVARKLWGYDNEDSLLGRHLFQLVLDEAAVSRLLATTVDRQEIWQEEIWARRRDGSKFLAQITAACNRNAQEAPIGAVVSIMDVTDARAAEEALRQAERQGAMLASLGAACHHLAQPATVLIGNLGILEQMSDQLPQEARELIQSTMEAGDRLTQILHRLNEVNEYRTSPYLESVRDTNAPENRLLEI